jgi:site-specific DNA recombinase
LRDRAAAATLDRILITAPDRLARNFVHQVLLVEELQRFGAQIEFLDRPMGQDPHDQLLLQIRGAVAEYERTLITERLRRGRLRKLRAGTLLPWTRPPYGYRLDPDHPRDPAGVRVEEGEAAVVRDLFSWYGDEAITLCGLIGRLHRLRIASPMGREHWTVASLRTLLSNPSYVGQIFANRIWTTKPQRRRSALKPIGKSNSTSRLRDRSEWIAVARIPALVTQEQFDRVQARFVENRQMAPRNNKTHTYLLRALVSCGLCQRRCCSRSLRGGYAYYLCQTKAGGHLMRQRETCPARYIPAEDLDALVWRDLCELIQHPDQIAQAMERARGGHWLPQELQARRTGLKRGRTTLTQQIERLTEAYLGGVIPLAEYERRRQVIEARLGSLDQQERHLLGEATRLTEITSLAAHAEAFSQRVAQGLEKASPEDKRALVELLVDRVIVSHHHLEIRYVIPTAPRGEQQRFCHLRMDYQGRLSQGRTDPPLSAPARPLPRQPDQGRRIIRSAATVPAGVGQSGGIPATKSRLCY